MTAACNQKMAPGKNNHEREIVPGGGIQNSSIDYGLLALRRQQKVTLFHDTAPTVDYLSASSRGRQSTSKLAQ